MEVGIKVSTQELKLKVPTGIVSANIESMLQSCWETSANDRPSLQVGFLNNFIHSILAMLQCS